MIDEIYVFLNAVGLKEILEGKTIEIQEDGTRIFVTTSLTLEQITNLVRNREAELAKKAGSVH